MNFADYVYKKQILDFELEKGGHKPLYTVRVDNFSDTLLTISVVDDDLDMSNITEGTKGIIWGNKKGLKYSFYVEVESIEDNCVIILKHIPSRTHLRVDAFINFKHRKISENEYLKKRKKYIQHMSSDSEGYYFYPSRYIGEDGDVQSSVPAEVVNEIHSIHRKLDFIIKCLGKAQGDNVFDKEPVEVNLSGSGMRFVSEDEFDTGDYLDIELLLPLTSGLIIDLIGQVARCTPVSDKNDSAHAPTFVTGIRFVAVNEDDREFIIRYVFKRQRELLRSEEKSETTFIQ